VKIYQVGSRGFLAPYCIWFSGNGNREERKKRLWKTLSNKGKDCYAEVGKAWKRDYLLYSPLGTGKSTMISAMANSLDYNVHDFELTTAKDSNELEKVLIETTGKSTIVVEDIDFSLDLTWQSKRMKSKDDNDDDKAAEKEPFSKLGLASGPCLICGFSYPWHLLFFPLLYIYIYIIIKYNYVLLIFSSVLFFISQLFISFIF